jgi:hypothetical protein
LPQEEGSEVIGFKDFVPRMIAAPGLFRSGEYESFEAALAAANQWIEENSIRIVNLETVVLPNIWSRWEEGSTDVAIGTSGETPSHWHQFIRCWYYA